MKAPRTHKAIPMAAVVGLALLLLPMAASGQEFWHLMQDDGLWIEGITHELQVAEAQDGKFQPYLGQMEIVRTAFLRRDENATYTVMNRFMDMLESRENGISAQTADMLFDFCYIVTPARFHDVSRHHARQDSIDRWLGENGFGDGSGG